MLTVNVPPPPIDTRHRRVPHASIVEMLILHAFAYDIEAGRRPHAIAKCSEAIENWLDAGLGFSLDHDGRPLFDPAETICFMKWSGATGHDRFWQDHWVSAARKFVAELAVPAGDARFTIGMTRSFDLRRFKSGEKVRLRLPLALRSDNHQDVRITPRSLPYDGATIMQSDGRLEVRLLAPTDGAVVIGADIDLLARGMTPVTTVLEPSEAELYLRPNEDMIRATPRVVDLATRLANGKSAQDSVEAFWDYLMDTLLIGAVRYDEISAESAIDGILDGGWCDCQLGSALFIALCRVIGVPARMMGGHFLYRLAPTKHYWAEVWLDGMGWLPYDCQAWDLSLGGRDKAWRDRFAGRIDHRMVTECFPRRVVGPMSVRFPPTWQMLQTPSGRGMEASFSNFADNTLIYRDHVDVTRTA